MRCCRCLGDPQFKENDKDVVDCTPEMRRVELQPGDFAIVLASDGLWDVLSDTEVVTILQKVSIAKLCKRSAASGDRAC